MKKAYVFLADGFEEIEGLTVVDVLRRAGAEVEMVSVMDRKEITGAHGIKVEADRMIEEARRSGSVCTSGRNAGDAASERACRTLQTAESGRKEGKAHCGDLCSTECPWRTGNAERKKGMLLSVL